MILVLMDLISILDIMLQSHKILNTNHLEFHLRLNLLKMALLYSMNALLLNNGLNKLKYQRKKKRKRNNKRNKENLKKFRRNNFK